MTQNTTAGTMCSTSVHLRTSSLQLTSLTFSAMPKSKMASDRDLLEMYAEELFVDEQHLSEDDADAQQHSSSKVRTVPPQACQPRPAQPSTLLFDVAESSKPVSQMLDSDHHKGDQVQEAAFEYAPARPGCSLTRPSPVYIDATLNELAQVSKRKISTFQNDGGSYMLEDDYERVLRQITRNNFLPGIEHLTAVEARSTFVTYDQDIQALQHATAEFLADSFQCSFVGDKVCATALPGDNFFLAENNTDIGLSAQYPTAESLLNLIDDLVDRETLVEELTNAPTPQQEQSTNSVYLPPGTFFDGSSSQFLGYTALDQILGFSNDVSHVVCAQSDAADDDVSDTCDEVAELTIAQPANISDEETDDLSMLLPSTLSYFDADTQQRVAYIAFNQLLMDLANDVTLPRIHRSDDDFEDDFASVTDILEISELPGDGVVDRLDNTAMHDVLSLPWQSEYAAGDFDLDFDSAQYPPNPLMVTNVQPRSANSLRSYSSIPRRSSSRPNLVINTRLSDVVEVSSSDSFSVCSSDYSSDASIDFADHRGFVRPLEARRGDFLDDEDSDDDHDTSTPLDASVVTPPNSTQGSPIVESTLDLFEDIVWQHGVILELTFPLTPTGPYSPAANAIPDPEILEALETEILKHIEFVFQCINGGRFAELQALASDLQWALGAIADVFPSFGMLRHMGIIVEILLGLVVASGSN
jgi:hypothetical protein